MKYRLYQIDNDRDRDRVKYLGLESIGKYQPSPEVNRSIYDMVYEAEYCGKDGDSVERVLEDLFFRFNCRLPEDFTGGRMSVSDVVEVIGEEGVSSFWYCDNIGFKEIPFRPAAIRDNAEHCVCCGDVIPEGRQVCPACERGE